MKLILLLFVLSVSISVSGQAKDSFSFFTDSSQYGNNKSQKHTSVVVKNGNLITLYDIWFFCSDGSQVVDTEEYIIEEEIKSNEFTSSTKMYQTTIKGENAIVIIDNLIKMAIFYAHGDRKDLMIFRGQK